MVLTDAEAEAAFAEVYAQVSLIPDSQVGDFGFAKITFEVNTHVSTRVMGTFGYLAPEYASSGKLTDKSDVLSFGVMLLELVAARRPVDTVQTYMDDNLVDWNYIVAVVR